MASYASEGRSFEKKAPALPLLPLFTEVSGSGVLGNSSIGKGATAVTKDLWGTFTPA